jgi:hypothetical protein
MTAVIQNGWQRDLGTMHCTFVTNGKQVRLAVYAGKPAIYFLFFFFSYPNFELAGQHRFEALLYYYTLKKKVPEHQLSIRGFENLKQLRADGYQMQAGQQAVRKLSYLEKLLQVQQAAKDLGLHQEEWFNVARTKEFWEGQIGRKISGKREFMVRSDKTNL